MVPRSRVQSDYYGFTYNGSNDAQKELGSFDPEENNNDKKEEENEDHSNVSNWAKKL